MENSKNIQTLTHMHIHAHTHTWHASTQTLMRNRRSQVKGHTNSNTHAAILLALNFNTMTGHTTENSPPLPPTTPKNNNKNKKLACMEKQTPVWCSWGSNTTCFSLLTRFVIKSSTNTYNKHGLCKMFMLLSNFILFLQGTFASSKSEKKTTKQNTKQKTKAKKTKASANLSGHQKLHTCLPKIAMN